MNKRGLRGFIFFLKTDKSVVFLLIRSFLSDVAYAWHGKQFPFFKKYTLFHLKSTWAPIQYKEAILPV